MLPDQMITTVIPTHRRPKLLRRAILSVLDQSYPHFKICVYDNASNDETGEVVRAMAALDSRIHYYCHPRDVGTQENFIYGLSRVETPFVHLISDDDFLLPGFFAQGIDALERNSRAAFFSAGILLSDPYGKVRGLVRYGANASRSFSSPALFKMLAPYTRTWTSALFRRSSLVALGGLKKETGYSFSIELILRSAIRFEAVLSDTPRAVFTVHPGSSSVAEASQAFESLLNLAFYDSLNRAIEVAGNGAILTSKDADEMRRLLRIVTEQNLFRGAFGVMVRGQLRIAAQASDVLATEFKRKDMAAMINVLAMENQLGSLLRLAMKAIKAIRQIWLINMNPGQYSIYSELVKNRMLQLDG